MYLRKLLKSKCLTNLLKLCSLNVGVAAIGVLLPALWGNQAVAAGVDVHQLHLPRSYLRYLPSMLDGARLMAADEHCAQFLAGDLNVDQSTLLHPVFRYQCRNPDGATYRWYVDGKSLAVIDETRPSARVSFAELTAEYERKREVARQLAAERQARIDALQRERQEVEELREAERMAQEQLEAERQEIVRRQRLWQTCKAQLATQTANMIERTWLTIVQPEAEVTAKRVRYTVDFNAQNLNGVELEYRAYCDAKNEGEILVIEIHPRALVPSASNLGDVGSSVSAPVSSQSSSSKR